jgi:spore coat polysaccharide biosynthesis predicted glycosyltransferase SpsG/CMP-N-acetylneuraminic acid synthetase
MNFLERAVIFIPAFRKYAMFENDILRKLSGVSLLQRVIDKAILLGSSREAIHLLTDTEEIALIGKRSNVGVFCRPILGWEHAGVDQQFREYLDTAEKDTDFSVLLSPYAPLLAIGTVEAAARAFLQTNLQVLKPVLITKHRFFDDDATLATSVFSNKEEVHRIESRAFTLLRSGELLRDRNSKVSVLPWDAGDDAFEIETLQDWWVSEKLLQRKRIVFRVIGNRQVGMGHVYRALALAHELYDHEVIFVTDTENKVAVEAIVKRDYRLGIYAPNETVNEIIRLKPDMVINDVLDTNKRDIQKIKNTGSMAVSFEDLGSGARCSDLTINEIYDMPRFEANHVLWGQDYFFLRDEFQNAHPQRFKNRVDSVMLAFGGTDQHDLARKVFHAIRPLCEDLGIFVHIVTGPGYVGYDRLAREIKGSDLVSATRGSEVISSIMEQAQVAITSNGRTVYEFAHMNVPAIVIAQHEREVTHSFASEHNGFLSLGIYQTGKTEQEVIEGFRRLVLDTSYRKQLFKRMSSHQFTKNKETVVNMIRALLNNSAGNSEH